MSARVAVRTVQQPIVDLTITVEEAQSLLDVYGRFTEHFIDADGPALVLHRFFVELQDAVLECSQIPQPA